MNNQYTYAGRVREDAVTYNALSTGARRINLYDVGTGATTRRSCQDPFPALKDTDIFINVVAIMNQFEEDVRHSLFFFIEEFRCVLHDIAGNRFFENVFPLLSVEKDPDGSAFIEWPFKDFRIGFYIEAKLETSKWYLITNKNLEEMSVVGNFGPDEMRVSLTKLIRFVLENS